MCYAPIMKEFNEKKRDGFKGEWMFVLPTEAFQEYMEHPQVRRLYLTDVGFFPHAQQHYRERREGIEEYIFIYCMEGSGTIELGREKRIVLKENEAFCIPRYFGHKYYACEQNPWSILWVHFKGEDVGYYPLEECQVVKFQSINSSSRMLSLFELLLQVLGGNYTLGNFIYISQVLSLVLGETYFREKRHTTLKPNKHVTNVIRFMYQHLQENLTLEEVAGEFDFSKSYLHAIFQKYTQHAPMEFYIQLKIKEACKLLRSTDLYIYEIGTRLGYKDQYYFSRIFKKVTGVSPKEYRESGAVDYKE